MPPDVRAKIQPLTDEELQELVAAGDPTLESKLISSERRRMRQFTNPTWSDKLGLNKPTADRTTGFLRGAGSAATDMAEGATSGLASTVFKGGDLMRRATGMERIVDEPDVQRMMQAPDSFQGSMGKMLEQGAEFAYPISKVSRAASAMSWIPRMLTEGAAGAGALGIQSGGDTDAMALGAALPAVGSVAYKVGGAGVRAAQLAANASMSDGIGGAIASVVRRAVPADAKMLLIQGLKPRNTKLNFARDLNIALPDIVAAEDTTGAAIGGVDDLLAATKMAKTRLWNQYRSILGDHAAASGKVDLSPVADEIVKSITKTLQLEDPARADAIRAAAKLYRDKFDILDVEDLLREANAQIETYMNKFPAARAAALRTNPEVAFDAARADGLRRALYETLENPTLPVSARNLMQRYGAVREVEDAAFRRSMVAQRQQPESLSEHIGKVRAAGDIARGLWRASHGDLTGLADVAAGHAMKDTATFMKEQQTSDALVRRAMQAFRGGRPVATPRPPVGYLPEATTRLGPSPDPSFARAEPAAFASHEPGSVGMSVTDTGPFDPTSRMLPPASWRVLRDPYPMGPSPDPSFATGQPGAYGAQSARPGQPQLPSARDVQLGPGPGQVPMQPPPAAASHVRGVSARSVEVVNPQTGEKTVVYLGE